MMATTHGLWGMLLAVPVAVHAPELAPLVLVAGFLGGIAPDLDLYVGHRKTLHFPFLGIGATAVSVGLALAVPTVGTTALAVAVAAATLHAVMDALGGGLELRPWEASSDRAVYSHVHGRWLPPHRAIRYDGAPEDLIVAAVVAFPVMAVGPGWTGWLVGAVLAVSTTYMLLRRHLAEMAIAIGRRVPRPVQRHLPRRYLGG